MSKVTGAKAFERTLRELPRKMLGGVEKGIEKTAQQIEDTARQNAPRITGGLQDSIKTVDLGGVDKEVIATVNYALDVHENPNSQGFKFLQTAVAEHTLDFENNVAEEARKAIGDD